MIGVQISTTTRFRNKINGLIQMLDGVITPENLEQCVDKLAQRYHEDCAKDADLMSERGIRDHIKKLVMEYQQHKIELQDSGFNPSPAEKNLSGKYEITNDGALFTSTNLIYDNQVNQKNG